ncbi:hypothetical protein HMPREF1548_02378 [Clostridium sp. KLE 1755]|nr:hypothetical protein HMPREF1548_02378 [Clostridium sp. KLE 1755]
MKRIRRYKDGWKRPVLFECNFKQAKTSAAAREEHGSYFHRKQIQISNCTKLFFLFIIL